jgi:hypothetical protein
MATLSTRSPTLTTSTGTAGCLERERRRQVAVGDRDHLRPRQAGESVDRERDAGRQVALGVVARELLDRGAHPRPIGLERGQHSRLRSCLDDHGARSGRQAIEHRQRLGLRELEGRPPVSTARLHRGAHVEHQRNVGGLGLFSERRGPRRREREQHEREDLQQERGLRDETPKRRAGQRIVGSQTPEPRRRHEGALAPDLEDVEKDERREQP